MLTAEAVLEGLTGQMTAQQIAERLGERTPREIVPELNELREQGRVLRRITSSPEGNMPIARWRLA